METKTKQWPVGSGRATIQYDGQGDDNIIITSDPNNHYEARSMQITVETTNGSPKKTKTITINQAAKERIDISAAVVTASNQTYNGSAKTPTPTVTLNGSTVPSSGYDVVYSDNTNAGTATITINGKGDYTGTAYGTFTINKATPTYTAPTYNDWTYDGSSHYLVTTGSTNHGTIQFSTDGSSWSTTRPTQTNAGVYYTYWRLVGDTNHTDISPASIRTDVSKATPSYTAPSTRSLTYNGSSQYLTTSGSTSHGTIYYSKDGSNWYTSRRTGTNAGTYYCYWKLVGDSNHTDISSTYLGTTSIAKASRSISFSSYPSELEAGKSSQISASVSAGSNDGTITFSTSNSSIAYISGNYIYASSRGSCTVSVQISEGTNYLAASNSYTLSVYKWELYNSDTIYIGANSSHSSLNDQISVSAPAGTAYIVTVYKDSSLGNCPWAVYGYPSFQTLAEYRLGNPASGTLSSDMTSVGIFVSNPSEAPGNVSFSIKIKRY